MEEYRLYVGRVRMFRPDFQQFALNLLLGWTLLGWVIALVWARKDPFAQGGAGGLTEQREPGDFNRQ